MISATQWENFPKVVRQKFIRNGYVYFPENKHGLREGCYSPSDILLMLRRRKTEKEIVQFILDRLE